MSAYECKEYLVDHIDYLVYSSLSNQLEQEMDNGVKKAGINPYHSLTIDEIWTKTRECSDPVRDLLEEELIYTYE